MSASCSHLQRAEELHYSQDSHATVTEVCWLWQTSACLKQRYYWRATARAADPFLTLAGKLAFAVPDRLKLIRVIAQKKRQRSQERPQGAGRTCTREEREEERKRGDEHVLGLGKGKATEQNEYLGKGKATEQNEYECPYCQAKTYSIVRTGTVHVAGHCGKQFRVRNGDVVRSFTHACPSCGTQVQSAKASGRIQSKHKKPNGKACPTTVWVQKWPTRAVS